MRIPSDPVASQMVSTLESVVLSPAGAHSAYFEEMMFLIVCVCGTKQGSAVFSWHNKLTRAGPLLGAERAGPGGGV